MLRRFISIQELNKSRVVKYNKPTMSALTTFYYVLDTFFFSMALREHLRAH